VEKNSKNMFMALISNAVRDGVNAQTYKKRAMLLKQMFDENACKLQPDGSVVLDTSCTGQFILKKSFNNFNSIVGTMVCHVCLNTSFREEIILIINLPTDDLIFLQDIMENYYFSPSNCENCNINMTQSLDFKEHLIIEPVVPETAKS